MARDILLVQMDLYHCPITEGDVRHIQIAGVPDRQEPEGGELNCSYLLALLNMLGYVGWVGCEYRPRSGTHAGATQAGLGWRNAWLGATSAG